eukprot:m.183635 g.183635  ORF g.183635 m.183635 type:complete len:117 (-) comp18482_c0_seq3:1044-1394(-)
MFTISTAIAKFIRDSIVQDSTFKGATSQLSFKQQPGAYIQTVAFEDATPPLLDLYQKHRNNDGSLDNILTIHSINPSILEAHFEMYKQTCRGDSPLSRLEREIVAVAVSLENKCRY